MPINSFDQPDRTEGFQMQKESRCDGTQFKFSQVFGYKSASDKIQEEDVISTLKFDPTGKFLALGDHAGRVIVFETPETKKKLEAYEYSTEFQSHIREFDPLRSQEVDEALTDICWMRSQGKYLKMITTNSKDIKIWKISEKMEKKVVKSAGKELGMPKVQNIGSCLTATCQKTFPSQHQAAINAISYSQNQEYILSTDDVQAYLWSIQKPNQPFMPVDLKGSTKFIEDIKENITCSKFHPTSDSLFLYGTNKGSLKLGDLRAKALCDSAINFKYESGSSSSSANRNFFTEMISSYSAVSFLPNGKHIISRDYLTIKIWDIANCKKPLASITVQDSLKSKLCEIFENDAIFDKFNLSCSADSSTIITGNYNNSFHLMNVGDHSNTQYELNYKKQTVSKSIVPNKMNSITKMDYVKKTVATDFHPKRNVVAVASLNCFFLYGM